MKPSSSFLHVLNQLQVKVRHAVASTGIGERRSRQKGSGMEFADYRAYVPGDDTRHLDARLHARLGDFFVREYEVLKQLPVTILIDGSRSMLSGSPDKLDLAKWLANCFGYIALSGGDVVRLAFWSGRRLVFSPRFQGVSRADRMFGWVETAATDGPRPFDEALAEAGAETPRNSLTIVFSDFWLEDPARLRSLAGGGAEVWAFQILAEEEIDPPYQAGGEVHLVDSESGEEILLAVDPAMLASYRDALAQWRRELTEALRSINGSMLDVLTAQDREKFLLGLRVRGFLT